MYIRVNRNLCNMKILQEIRQNGSKIVGVDEMYTQKKKLLYCKTYELPIMEL